MRRGTRWAAFLVIALLLLFVQERLAFILASRDVAAELVNLSGSGDLEVAAHLLVPLGCLYLTRFLCVLVLPGIAGAALAGQLFARFSKS